MWECEIFQTFLDFFSIPTVCDTTLSLKGAIWCRRTYRRVIYFCVDRSIFSTTLYFIFWDWAIFLIRSRIVQKHNFGKIVILLLVQFRMIFLPVPCSESPSTLFSGVNWGQSENPAIIHSYVGTSTFSLFGTWNMYDNVAEPIFIRFAVKFGSICTILHIRIYYTLGIKRDTVEVENLIQKRTFWNALRFNFRGFNCFVFCCFVVSIAQIPTSGALRNINTILLYVPIILTYDHRIRSDTSNPSSYVCTYRGVRGIN